MTIDEFIASPLSGDCSLLKRLYDFEYQALANKLGCVLSLLDIESYEGTALCNPALTPINSVTFATTGGDDVHFGLVAIERKYSDLSPIVMTVPMAGDNPKETNFVVGESLHEFLRLGCVHDFFDLEKLAYSWRTDLFGQYKKTPALIDEPIYVRFRKEFELKPWIELESRFQELQNKYWPLLRFRRG